MAAAKVKKPVPVNAATDKIKELQRKLGVVPDGIIGNKTRAAAKAQGVTLPTQAQLNAYMKLAKPSAPKPLAPVPPVAKIEPVVALPPPIPPSLLAPPAPLPPIDVPEPAPLVNVASLAAAIPAPARATAAAALQQLALTPGIQMSDVDRLVAGLTSTMAPQLTAIAEALKQRETVQQATGESNAVLAENDWREQDVNNWKANFENWKIAAERAATTAADSAQTQAKILEAIAALAGRITAKTAVEKRIYQAYGIPT